MSIESVMPSSHLILGRPFLLLPPILPASESFAMSQLFTWGGQSTGVSASASVPPMNIQDWFPLRLTSLISLLSGDSEEFFSSTTIQKHRIFSNQSSLWSNSHIYTWLLENHSFDYMDLCWQSKSLLFNMLSRLVIAFLPRSKHLLISRCSHRLQWFWSPRK